MTSRTLVITGANGFVGAHLAEIAAEEGHRVWAVGRESEPAAELAPHCAEYFTADLTSAWTVPEGADAVVHLAGLAAVGPSFSDPQRYISINSAIMSTMGEALLRSAAKPRIVVASSGAVYSPPLADRRIDESHPTSPNSPYAVAKLLVETQAAYYSSRGLDTVVARPFNHIGPRQSLGFLVPDLTAALRSLRAGDPLVVGDLATTRDYTDVRDVAAAYLLLSFAPSHRHHVYNVATGAAHSGHEVLDAVAKAIGCEVPPLSVDRSRLRPNDPRVIVGDATRLREEFGWKPRIPWEESIREYVEANA